MSLVGLDTSGPCFFPLFLLLIEAATEINIFVALIHNQAVYNFIFVDSFQTQ